MPSKPGKILEKIDYPDDLRKLPEDQLPQVCKELRQFIIDEVSLNPGHFGASLGVVELTVALHYIFDTPRDLIVWDVGHQAYGHKILTGRKEVFHTNRKYKGISGFPTPKESEYDAFGVGHSSTSISAALGMAIGSQFNKENRRVIAVIGDGSMTGGMAFEGLNNVASTKANILVILNDNNMAIDPNTGSLSEYLIDISTSKTYNKVKDDVWRMLGKVSRFGPNAQAIAQKINAGIKTIVLRNSNLFQSLGIRYFGPIDGHDIVQLTKVLRDLKNIPGPKILHCKTIKGKGFKQAEISQTIYHAPGLFDKKTGELFITKAENPDPPKFQDVFGETIIELAEKNHKIIGITPAMASGCSLNLMMEKMPERTFDVGIAEQHAVTFSAGLAARGMIPFCNIYSTFMQRAYDQVIHDVALQNLNVVFCLDRAGLVGSDGATHHGAYDMAFFRCIPNLTISSPMDEEELRNLMYTAQLDNMGPFVIRYPRGSGVMYDWKKPFKKLQPGRGRMIRDGRDAAVLTIGPVGNMAVEADKNEIFDIAHYDMRYVKPLDEKILHEVFTKFKNIITIEDGVISGGFGSAVLEFMNDNGYHSKVVRLGIPDKFIEHGSQQQLRKDCGIDAENIKNTIQSLIKRKVYSRAK
ncbi:MAG: 1-deoxy-D-xylulose-5-phosphate synthase [Bacteroidia bacterium]|nr:1-deoxy-D-xylulose-5-phosphate synthase [Bacteroidia bacterium]